MSRPFAKYEGLGNDFVIVDAQTWPLESVTREFARSVCDRHLGVGADGVLWVGPGDGETSDAKMVVVNADGSRPEMCGNGVRCVVAYLVDRGRLAQGGVLRLATDAGLRPAAMLARAGGHSAATVEVDMGPVRITRERERLDAAGHAVEAVAVDVGNPHAVIFDSVPSGSERSAVAAAESRRDVWPHGVNVEFVATRNAGAGLRVRVHERGVGWTQACGTGACAVAAAAVTRRLAGAVLGEPLAIELDGGLLAVTITASSQGELRAKLTGPARRVFAGELDAEPSATEARA